MPTGDKQDIELAPGIRTGGTDQKLFGRYTLKRVLGRGGMGIVWLAHDDELIRYVAMKFLPDMLVRDREAVEDLKRETRRSLDLTHHHIVRIYDFTQDDMCAAIIMEYVDGETLSAMKSQQPGGCFGVSVVAPWVAHFASALDYAHRQARVIHRDLKPANLMINSRGDLKITDFGISRSMSDSMTRVSVSNTAGTLAYMSPEQALGAPPAPGDDIYAFGATVYDLLTGRPPFFRGNLQVQLETVIPPRLEDRRAELGNSGEPIPELWEEVIAACLAKRPQDRPQSVAEVAALLGLGGTTSGGRPGTSTGTTATAPSGTTRTRAHGTDEAATEDQLHTPAPGTARPSTSRPTVAPRPTGLEDVLSAPSIRDEQAIVPPQARVTAAPGRGGASSQTVPPEDLTIHGLQPIKPAPEEPAAAEESSSAAASTSAPASTPARKSPGLAFAALGSLALVALAVGWMFLKPEPEPAPAPLAKTEPLAPPVVVAKTEPVAPTAPPPPNFDALIAEVRKLIEAGQCTTASDAMTKLPPDHTEMGELKTALATKQAAMKKAEDDAAMAKRTEAIGELLRTSDAAFAASNWTAARTPLQRVLAEFDSTHSDATTRLAKIDDAERMMTAKREDELLANILESAKTTLEAGDHANARDILNTAPPSRMQDPAVVALGKRIDDARLAAMSKPDPTPVPKPVVTTKKPSASQPSRTTTRRDDEPRRTQTTPARTVSRPPEPPPKKEAVQPPAPIIKKRPSSINRGTNIGG